MKIQLVFHKAPDPEALQHNFPFTVCRVFSRIRLKTQKEWSQEYLGIVDTGAPYSVIPAPIWRDVKREYLYSTELRGVIPHKKAHLKSHIANISIVIIDPHHTSSILTLPALLTHASSVPLILGFAGCLERCKLVINPKANNAHLDFH